MKKNDRFTSFQYFSVFRDPELGALKHFVKKATRLARSEKTYFDKRPLQPQLLPYLTDPQPPGNRIHSVAVDEAYARAVEVPEGFRQPGWP